MAGLPSEFVGCGGIIELSGEISSGCEDTPVGGRARMRMDSLQCDSVLSGGIVDAIFERGDVSKHLVRPGDVLG